MTLGTSQILTESTPDVHTLRRRGERRWLRSLRVVAAPAVFIIACAVLLFVNTVPFIDIASAYTVDIREQVASRLAASALALLILDAVGMWMLGVVAAILSSRMTLGQGVGIDLRLIVMQQRYAFLAWAASIIRALGLATAGIAVTLALTPAFGVKITSDLISSLSLDARYQPVTVSLTAIIVLAGWTFGPFIRLRFSLALGMLAATWSKRPNERFWLALSARLFVEMLGSVAIVWGICLLNLVAYIAIDPLVGAGISNSLPAIIGMFPLDSVGGSNWLGIAIALSLLLFGQLGLPFIFLRIVRWRLRRQARQSDSLYRTIKQSTLSVSNAAPTSD